MDYTIIGISFLVGVALFLGGFFTEMYTGHKCTTAYAGNHPITICSN